MRLLRCFFYFLLFYISLLQATEYVYPVACNKETIFYIHQHTPTNIELFEWNTSTHKSEQILWSLFNPAGLQLLPDNSGFSFIDNGRLRIKLFQRRTPKAIDFDDPLFNINALHWIDEHTCYCSGQSSDNFSIFQLHDDGTMHCLVGEKGKDYMYPQKVDTLLFYIERSTTNNLAGDLCYRIMSCMYQTDISCASGALIIDFQDKPIVFLTMTSHEQGFALEHPRSVDSDSQTTPFSYHRIIKNGDSWSKNLLFSFTIPTNLLLPGDLRLYESLLPLLPRIIDNKIYFVDCAKNSPYGLEPYYYDLATKLITKIAVPAKKQGHYFVPMLCGKKLYCGGTFQANKNQGEKEPFISFLT